MGRRQYLTRLALGRSAFQDPEESDAEIGRPPLPPRTIGDGDDAQQYNSKGRPINPEIEAFNARMRKAQNEVLALVGVVEKKDHVDQANELRYKYINRHRQAILLEENERGQLLEYLILLVNYFGHLRSNAFRQRIQIGFYDTTRSMAEILTTEWRATFLGGIRWTLATRCPAVGDMIVHALVRLPCIVVVEQVTGRLQEAVITRHALGRKTREYLYGLMDVLYEVALLGIDIALLPMEYHAYAQRLGLAPVLPLFPSLNTFLPWHLESFHRYGWQPLYDIPFLRSFTSPAAIMLMYKYIHHNADDTGTPPFSLVTSFRYPWASEAFDDVVVPKKNDPFGRMLYYAYSLRNRFMQWAGWTIVKRAGRPRRENDFEGDTRLDRPIGSEPIPVHRSTVLARLPAQMLVESIDKFFGRLMVLPFESLMLRTVALTYLAAPVAKTAANIAIASRLYRPFGGGPLMAVLRTPGHSSTWCDAGQYISRLGLSIALTCAIDTIIFSSIYRCVREFGVKQFDWGRKGKIGEVIYTEAGMEGFEGEIEVADTS